MLLDQLKSMKFFLVTKIISFQKKKKKKLVTKMPMKNDL